MSCSTHFILLYSNLDDSKKFSKELIDAYALQDFEHNLYYSLVDEAENAKRFAEVGIPSFLEFSLEEKIKSSDRKHEYTSHRQVIDPLPIWIETKTGHRYYEMSDYEFLSDFDDLYKYYNLSGQGKSKCVEISKEDALLICRAIDYILLGKYDRDVERIFLEGNPFISVLEDVYPKFTWRFRKTNKTDSNKTIVILKEKNSEFSNESFDDEDSYEDDECESDWESEGRYTLERLRTVMENFLHLANEYKYSDDKHDVKLVYFLSI